MVWDAAEAAAAGGDGDAWLALVRGTPAAVLLGIAVDVLTGGGVAEMGAGQTPAGEGGTDESLWPS